MSVEAGPTVRTAACAAACFRRLVCRPYRHRRSHLRRPHRHHCLHLCFLRLVRHRHHPCRHLVFRRRCRHAARLRLHLRRRFAARLARGSSRTASTLVLGATWRVVRRSTAGVGSLEVFASAVAATLCRWVRFRLLLRRRLRRRRCHHRLRRRRRSRTRVRRAGMSVMARESAVSAASAALAVERAFSWALVSVASAR